LIGGVEAVIWADAVQSVVFTLGAIFCLGTILWGFPGGAGQALRIAAADHKFSLGDFALDFAQPTFWVALAYGLFVNLNNFGIDQNYVQRYASAKTAKDATRSLWLGALLYPPISVLFLLIGTMLYSYYKVHATPGVPTAPDKVLPFFMAGNLPPGLLGLLVASLFAAGQSTVASSINSSATIILHDIFKRFIRPDANEATSLRVLRVASLVFGVLGTATALAMMNVESALDAWWKMQSIFSGGMLGLFLLSLASKHPATARALTATILGLIVLLWISLPNEFPKLVPWLPKLPVHSFLAIVFGTLVILLAGLLLPLRKTNHS
jgi:SSS family solute:Na+ symporter